MVVDCRRISLLLTISTEAGASVTFFCLFFAVTVVSSISIAEGLRDIFNKRYIRSYTILCYKMYNYK